MADKIRQLISWIGNKNIAEDIEKDVLRRLALRVIENYNRDLESMTEWSSDIKEGQRIAKQESNAKSEPFEGAANFKSTIIESASISFGDRATTELLRGKNIVKSEIIGNDAQGNKKIASDNIVDFMNWQLNHQMRHWRDTQETVLYALPSFGTVFKKVFFDPIEGINKSEIIHWPDFAVNQAANSHEKCFSESMDISANEVIERQAAKIWLDVDLYPETEDAEGDRGSNEDEGVIHAVDNSEKFIEQACFFDLDEDEYEEPYIVTVHEQTSKVVRIVARYDRSNVFVSQGGRIVSLKELKSQAKIEPGSEVDLTGAEIVRITPDQNIIKYDFVKSIDGTYLGRGYYHMLGSLSKGINSTTNQLIDSGTLATLQGGFLAKGFRKKMGNLRMKPGSWQSTDISAIDLRNGMMPHQFKEPSQVLFALNQQLNQEAKDFSVNIDLQGVIAPNAPATTTLALIQEAMMPTSAIMQRVIRSESKEFQLLFVLDSKFTDPVLYQKILDDTEANFETDFDLDTMDISPTASADMSSKMQRLQRAEILILEAPQIALEGGDTQPIRELWFEAIGAEELINKVWPDPQQLTEQQQARAAAQEQEQRKQDQFKAIEIDHQERALVAAEQKSQADVAKSRAEITEILAGMKKIESEIILNLEKAETEQSKNKINIYTAEFQGLTNAMDATLKSLEFDNNERDREDARKLSEQNAGAAQS